MFQVGTACYSTATQAAQASASSQVGAVVSHGGVSYVVDLVEATGNALTYRLQPMAGGTALQTTVGYTAQPCGLLQVEDGLTIGWMIAAAWIGAYALLFIAKVLRGDNGETYGNA